MRMNVLENFQTIYNSYDICTSGQQMESYMFHTYRSQARHHQVQK